MKRLISALSVLMMISIVFSASIISDSSESDSEPLVRFSAVVSANTPEGVAVTNFGTTDINLGDYHISDGEGTVEIDDFILASHATLYIMSAEPTAKYGDIDCIVNGNGCTFSYKFALKNSGDDIYLMKGDVIVDTFCYGDVVASDGWTGEAFEVLPTNSYAMRVSLFDTDCREDWHLYKLGVEYHPPVTDGISATVEPFVLPESQALPLLKTISETNERLDISIYMLTYRPLVAILLDLLDKGVIIRIVSEETASGSNEAALNALSTLYHKGAEVRMMKSIDDFRRFTYTHAKYVVVDDDKVIITSENWSESSFTGNRGWGVIVTSKEFADYYRNVFEDDFSSTIDTVDLDTAHPGQKTSTYSCDIDLDYDPVTYTAIVYPVLSPDSSWNTMKALITGAERYVYSEQLNTTYSWSDGGDNPLMWMVNPDLDTRLMINSSFDRDDEDDHDSYGLIKKMDGNGISVRTLTNTVIHNKGVIADDKVWVGSVNWTKNSFMNNREAAVIIQSQEVSDYYKEYFLKDWGGNAPSQVIKYPNEIYANKEFILNVDVSSSTGVKWDLDGDGQTDRTGSSIVASFPEGTHKVTVYIGSDENHSVELEVKGAPAVESPINWVLILILIVCIAVLIRNVYVYVKRRKNDSSGVQNGRFR